MITAHTRGTWSGAKLLGSSTGVVVVVPVVVVLEVVVVVVVVVVGGIVGVEPVNNIVMSESIRDHLRDNKSMTSSNGNIFRVIGLLCGEFTGHRWIPRTQASDAELGCLLDLHLNKRLSKQSSRQWFETPSCSLWRHCNANERKDEH